MSDTIHAYFQRGLIQAVRDQGLDEFDYRDRKSLSRFYRLDLLPCVTVGEIAAAALEGLVVGGGGPDDRAVWNAAIEFLDTFATPNRAVTDVARLRGVASIGKGRKADFRRWIDATWLDPNYPKASL